MERNIIISIHPEHVKNIIKGTKRFEYRTRVAKQKINKLLIYETFPTKKVIGEVKIVKILAMKPNDLWNETKEFSGISKEFFDQYFKNKDIAYAYYLGKVIVYDKPKELYEFGLNCAPQAYAYVNYKRTICK